MPKKGLLRNIQESGNRLTCELHASTGFANAIRRAIMENTESYAPDKVIFQRNTTCMPDEYIAHRIGMVPFQCSNTVEYIEATIDVDGRNVTGQDIQGARVAFDNVPIIDMLCSQQLKCRILFRKSSGKEHSRFCQAAGVGYRLDKRVYHLSFETINNERPLVLLRQALTNLKQTVASLDITHASDGRPFK